MRKPTGTEAFDTLLEGGIESDILTIIYGPAGSGKTNVCIHAAIACVNEGKKVIYVDTEGGFSGDRLLQIKDGKEALDSIYFLRPTTFAKQKEDFEKLKQMVDEKVGLIVVDTIAMLYRLEIGKSDKLYALNRELGRQISFLSELARTKDIPVLITNQVYTSFEQNTVTMVGGDLLKYQSKCLIELQRLKSSHRAAILRKHRSILEDKKILFEIKKEGLILQQSPHIHG
ncbi:MAG: DNA repair and recombination protein RadB [Nanobdellota archaeon]